MFKQLRFLALCAAVLLTLATPASPARAATELWLPTPAGATWKIIQGYGCGTHDAWDHYSLDLVATDGATIGAPVRAAAAGEVFVWVAGSGTLIINHGGGLYTQYTHLQRALVSPGARIERGQQIGEAGERATRGNPHLHFTAFTAEGGGARNRRSVAVTFADGYPLPEIGGCNQYGGTRLTAAAGAAPEPPGLSTAAEPGRWYREDLTLRAASGSITGGIAFAWNREPGNAERTGTDTPISLAAAGEGQHTLYVRGWDAHGRSALTTFGPIGYDIRGPSDVARIEPVRTRPGSPLTLVWAAAQDAGVGIAGYRIYVGTDAAGTGDWFTEAPTLTLMPAAGTSLVRVQPVDTLGNTGAWTTLTDIVVVTP